MVIFYYALVIAIFFHVESVATLRKNPHKKECKKKQNFTVKVEKTQLQSQHASLTNTLLFTADK